MQLKDIVVCVTNASSDLSAIDLGAQLAADFKAHVACSAIGIQQSLLFYNEFGMSAAHVEHRRQEKELISRFWTELKDNLENRTQLFELRRLSTHSANLENLVAAIARHSDLAIVRAPEKEAVQPHSQMIEALLLGSGRPVLVAPARWAPGPVGRRIVIGWDASREAARAMHDALLLASPDADITIATVDAKLGSLGHGDAPGLDIAVHLARHGRQVALRNEASLGRPVHEVLMQVATDMNADLMALGGYRHSRLQQALFGGVTRNMLRDTRLPLLLAH